MWTVHDTGPGSFLHRRLGDGLALAIHLEPERAVRAGGCKTPLAQRHTHPSVAARALDGQGFARRQRGGDGGPRSRFGPGCGLRSAHDGAARDALAASLRPAEREEGDEEEGKVVLPRDGAKITQIAAARAVAPSGFPAAPEHRARANDDEDEGTDLLLAYRSRTAAEMNPRIWSGYSSTAGRSSPLTERTAGSRMMFGA